MSATGQEHGLRAAPTLLVLAGGTGGHVFPGLAVAQWLRGEGWNVAWLGGEQGLETRLVPAAGITLHSIRFRGVRGKGLGRWLALPATLLRAALQSARLMARVRPDVVLGMGGYVSFPAGVVAWLTRTPLVLHEQNAVAGLANRLLARLATRVLSGFPAALPGSTWCGNPVRAEIAALPAPSERFLGRKGPLRLLVLGGSLGAQALNEVLPRALALLSAAERPRVTHQAGAAHLETLRANYAQAGVEANAVAFIADMAAGYGEADLVVCRAGALTVAELACAGVGSVLVPFPFAVDDHQSANARLLVDAGAALLIPQARLEPQALAKVLREIDRTRLLGMAEQARALAKADAVRCVGLACMEAVI